MALWELFVLAVGLSMDAFAVSICKGLALRSMSWKKALIVGLYFGGFQAGMPLLGYLLGVRFQDYIVAVDHWIAFVLLGLIGFNMIRESRDTGAETSSDSVAFQEMVVLAVATSIDALAVGVTFAFLKVDLLPAVSFIGVTTLLFSMAGVKIGNVFGVRYKSRAEFAGGLILMLLGLKILLEHLGFIG